MANSSKHTIAFYPLGCADTTRINLGNGRKVLFDYAHMRNDNGRRLWYGTDIEDLRCELPKLLREDLADRDYYDVVAFTHLDQDHTHRADEFFHLEYSASFQGGERIKMNTMWVPAAALVENCTHLDTSAYRIQREVRHRFDNGSGVVIYSRPGHIKAWCERTGRDFESKKHLIRDAGECAPGFTLDGDGLEFFVHAPLAWRAADGSLDDRNDHCLVMQALFEVSGVKTSLLLTSDALKGTLGDIVQTTKRHHNEDRLKWDIYKTPHHGSYRSVGPIKGEDYTQPTEDIKWLLETQGQERGLQVCSSERNPPKGTDEDKDDYPPHRQALAYYEDVRSSKDGRLEVTMEYPREDSPKPLIVEIGVSGWDVVAGASSSAASIVSQRGNRAGAR